MERSGGLLGAAQQNCKKALTESEALHIWPLTEAVLPVSNWLHPHRSPTLNGQPVPVQIGDRQLSAVYVDGSLTSSVLDEGTCGRRRPVRGAQGSGYGLIKPSHTLSFVSITFDSAGIGSLKLMPCRSADLGPCLLGV